MRKIRVLKWFHNHKVIRSVLNVLLMGVVIGFFLFGLNVLYNIGLNGNNSFTAVFGSILGAVIGGLLAFSGSVYIHNKQIKSNSVIRRKIDIYAPLYDNLIWNRDY